MNEDKKCGYIYDEKLNMYVPNLPRKKIRKSAFDFINNIFCGCLNTDIFF